MHATLIVVDGAKRGRIHLRLPTTIGRSDRAKIKLRASLVSRTHCELSQDDGQLVIRDLGSSNGTFVNGQKIAAPRVLVTDDQLCIGPVTFRVLVDRVTATDDQGASSVPAADCTASKQDQNMKTKTPPDKPLAANQADVAVEKNVTGSIDEGNHIDFAQLDDALVSHENGVRAKPGDQPISEIAKINYQLDDEGSVLHIEDVADFLQKLEEDNQDPDIGESALHALDDEDLRVESDDSALNDFLRKIDE